MNKTLSLWLPTILWVIGIFTLSSIPKLELTQEPLWNFITRKLAHLFEYGVLFILFNRSFEGKRPVTAFILTSLYGVVDEMHQIFVPLREGSPIDVMVDAIGACLGWLAARRFNWVKSETG